MAHPAKMQLYLRAEPTERGRELILLHQKHIAEVLRSLKITPRLVEKNDFHRTELFIGSAYAWARSFREIGVHIRIRLKDLEELINISREKRLITKSTPWHYEPFFISGNRAAIVLRLKPNPSALTKNLIRHAEKILNEWEREGRFPKGTTLKLLRSRLYPLARDRDNSKPHLTLARIRVQPKRKSEIAHTLCKTPLALKEPIEFVRIDLRAVCSKHIITSFAP